MDAGAKEAYIKFLESENSGGFMRLWRTIWRFWIKMGINWLMKLQSLERIWLRRVSNMMIVNYNSDMDGWWHICDLGRWRKFSASVFFYVLRSFKNYIAYLLFYTIIFITVIFITKLQFQAWNVDICIKVMNCEKFRSAEVNYCEFLLKICSVFVINLRWYKWKTILAYLLFYTIMFIV